MQTPIPCLFMRGGTSRGPFFLETDLPADVPTRDNLRAETAPIVAAGHVRIASLP